MEKCLKALLLSICLFSLVVANFAQNTLIFNSVLPWKGINSSGDESDGTIFFKGESFADEASLLPFFFDQKQLNQFSNVLGYRFTAQEVTSLSENLLSEEQKPFITADFQTSVMVRSGGEFSYLILKVLPIRKSGGSFEVLTSFSIEVTFAEAPTSSSRTLTFAENSVLSEGEWYRIAIARDGVYRMDRSFLTGLGINTATLNPQQINIYGNGGELLPSSNSVPRKDDLVKNAIVVQGESDGVFNDNDFILFYGKGSDTWTLQNAGAADPFWAHSKHFYSDSAYYFIRVDDPDPLRIQTAGEITEPASQQWSTFQDYQYIENDLININKSGREFFGDAFEVTTNASYGFNFPNVLPQAARLDYGVAVRSLQNASNFTFNIGSSSVTSTNSVVTDSPTSNVASLNYNNLNFTPSGSPINVGVVFNKGNAEAQGWLDFIRVNCIRGLVMSGSQMRFRDSRTVGPGNITEFFISQAATISQIWDITDYTSPVRMPITTGNSTLTFKAATSEVREFVSFTTSGFLTPTPIGKLENQNLHALSDIDLVIISAPNHLSSANQLADMHREEGLTVAVVTPFQVFNEFSGGNPDVIAFRMLMKMLYDRAAGDPELAPDNLLIYGDGSYLNNKGINASISNNVLVFESDNSVSPLVSYVSDDYFVFLDDNESGISSDKIDCGVGRIPASSANEGTTYLAKLVAYKSNNTAADGGAFCVGDATGSPFGPWRNVLTFVSDDQDGNGAPFETFHLTGSEALANIVSNNYPQYDISKLYLDTFTQTTTPGGERYPQAEEAIRQRIENGSLLVTYTGHGGERGWANERILTIPTIEEFTNINRMPVFLTATCELARYDDPGFDSAGEILLMNPNGGAIAMLTTTRIVTSGSNQEMNNEFFSVAFEKENISKLTLGKINMLTKNGVSNGNTSKLNFSLMGDPAMMMVYPKKYVYVTAINGTEISAFTDTLKALQEVTFTGYVGDFAGNKLNDFNGFVYPSVFDKETVVQTQNNDGGVVQSYPIFNNNLFRGKASVNTGDFSFKFVIPYDINYTVDTARVSFYAVAGNVDAHGAERRFRIGGALSGAELNTVGPEINLFMNDSSFVSGGVTSTEPVFIARLRDENGINTAGSGIGHDLIAIIDNDTQNPINLNDFYESDLDTYKSGQVRYQLNEIEPGNHRISFKAWDVHNNSSESSLEFLVADDAGIALDHVLNYPNPFTTQTQFMFEHNQACEFLDVRIQVFTVSGKLVKTINERVKQNGFRSDSISWDGRDDFGDRIGKGVYVYKLEVRNDQGERAEEIQKLVILK